MVTLLQLATFPFLPGARDYLATLGLSLDLLVKVPAIAARTKERLQHALLFGNVPKGENAEHDLLSFAAGGLICAAIQNDFLTRKWSEAEANRVFRALENESLEFVKDVVGQFRWKVTKPEVEEYFSALHFSDYLPRVAKLRDPKWRLVNRVVWGGFVHLMRNEVHELLGVDLASWVHDRVQSVGRVAVQDPVKPLIQEIASLAVEAEDKLRARVAPRRGWEPPWVSVMLRGVGRGMRDEAAIRLASYYVNMRNMSDDEGVQLLIEWNKKNTPPIGQMADDPRDMRRYFDTKAKSARRGGYIYGPSDPIIREILAGEAVR